MLFWLTWCNLFFHSGGITFLFWLHVCQHYVDGNQCITRNRSKWCTKTNLWSGNILLWYIQQVTTFLEVTGSNRNFFFNMYSWLTSCTHFAVRLMHAGVFLCCIVCMYVYSAFWMQVFKTVRNFRKLIVWKNFVHVFILVSAQLFWKLLGFLKH